jgi:hypothetical protein
MTNRSAETSPLVYARIAGILFLIMMVVSFFSLDYVAANLIVAGDATATANNIMASESLFRLGIVGHLVVLFTDVGVSILLYILLKPVSKTLSLVAAVFRLVMTAMRGINLVNHFFALLLLSGAGYLTVFEPDQLHALVLLFLTAFEDGFLIDLTFFGLHLLFLGYLVFKSGYLPRILGVLVIIGGFGYLIDSFAVFLIPNYEVFLRLFMAWGELLLALWLLVKGVNVEKWEKRALESA